MLRRLRNYLQQYLEILYMLYFLPLAGCVAMGISSSQLVYRLAFVFAAFFLSIKLLVTDYSKKDLLFMTAIMLLFGYVFYRAREKALIITAISIFGCKDVNVKKVLKYTFFVYIIGMGITISLVLAGKIPGEIHQLPKSGIIHEINDFGFSHPNSAYSHLLMIVFMAVVVWGDELRWYHHGIMVSVMYIAYKVSLSRTGFLIYILLCGILLLFQMVKQEKIRKALGLLWSILPLGISAVSYVLTILYPQNIGFVDKLNIFITGRIGLSSLALENVKPSWFGLIEKNRPDWIYIDNAYMNLFLVCGIFVFTVSVLSYFLTCYFYWKSEQYYVLIILGMVSIYAFMEYSPVNVTWNPILLFMSESLFGIVHEKNFATCKIRCNL